MIDLHKLRVFHVVAQAGSFSAAADRLYITQSAVSQQMKELEAGLGQPLFERGWRGVRLTAGGELLAQTAAQVFMLIAQAEARLTDVHRLAAGKVIIAATPGVGAYLAPQWIHDFRAAYPNLTVTLNTGITPQVVEEVLTQRGDLGVVEGEPEGGFPPRLGHVTLAEVEQVVVVGFRHPLWERERATLSELADQLFIMRQQGSQSRIWLDRALKQHGIEPQIAAEFDNFEAMKRAVAAGTCLAVLPPYVAEDAIKQGALRAVAIEGHPFLRPLRLIWDADMPLSALARAFLTSLSARYGAIASLLSDQDIS